MNQSIINDEREIRLEKLKNLKDQGIEVFPSQSSRTHCIAQALSLGEDEIVLIAGRLMSKRIMGKLVFCDLRDESGRMQVVFKEDDLGSDSFKLFVKKIDIGDFIELKGKRFITKKREESVLVEYWTLLAKALRPLPDKFHGLHDEELRLRKRYIDLLVHPELKNIFEKKSIFWNSMREFLGKEGFLEVETPILETSAGGADATPFATHHNALDLDVYLRISTGELWQKRLMVAGFEKTFEIGRQFRNEGMSREHLQDYTQMEFYWAYADYRKGMELVERLYTYVIQKTFGTLIFDIGEFKDIDLEKPWQELDYVKEIQTQMDINILDASSDDIHQKLRECSIPFEKNQSKGRLIDALWKQCRKRIKGPVFLVNQPVEVSPLAKRKSEDPRLVERYQIVIAGSELGNGYSELNDPLDQAERFMEQSKMREAGDTEAQAHDQDFVEALEHGMPPTTGFGVSERLFSFLMDKPIRECVLFPLMKPEIPQDVKIKKTKDFPLV